MGEMQPKSDAQLLREYAESGSESAFTELVARHTDLVYSAALRQVPSSDLACDVAQNVFTSLARGARTLAGKLNPDASLAGWLCRCTRNLALNLRRDDFRRHSRERQAMETLHPTSETAPDWGRLRPLLDEAISGLNEMDHDALVLRFFKNLDLRSVGLALGVSDDTAQKRVARALEKLRDRLAHHGITTTGAALAMAISANAVQAAPVGLAVTISAAAVLAGTAVSTSTVITATKIIAMTTLQKTLITATITAAVGAGIFEAHQASTLRSQNQTLQQQQATLTGQIAQLKSDNEGISNRFAQAGRSPSLSSERLRELLKLRGEVGVLRRQQRELEQAAATAQPKARDLTRQPASAATPQSNVPAPFQMQLVLDEPGEDTEPMTNNASGASGETLQVQKTPLMDYTAINSATVTTDPSSGDPEINVELSDVGKELFAAVTKENLNKRLAIVLDGQLYMAPVIRSEITGGKVQITGHFTEEEASELAAKINGAIGSQ
jgi:RNA polymerase sigma factor (sigma-70 family)